VTITCPKCGKTSYHPEDERQRYCGHCHQFHADMVQDEDRNRAEFSVCQFFIGGSHEYVRRFVTADEAWDAFVKYTTNVAARNGFVVRVIITDGGDYTNAEWQFGKGLTYPPVENPHALGN
jgi:hypothetical protein